MSKHIGEGQKSAFGFFTKTKKSTPLGAHTTLNTRKQALTITTAAPEALAKFATDLSQTVARSTDVVIALPEDTTTEVSSIYLSVMVLQIYNQLSE